MGALLPQKQEHGESKAGPYISRALTPVEQSYAQIEKEALATTWAYDRLSHWKNISHRD